MNLEDLVLENIHNIMSEAERFVQEGRERHYYDQSRKNPFDHLSDNMFIRLFRLNKQLVRELLEKLNPFLTPPRRIHDLDKETKVLVALKFFASGSYQMDIGANVWVGVSQSSVSRSIEEVSAALNSNEIFNEYVKFPSTIRECEILRENFNQKFEFPGVIGVIDCTHVAIVPPSGDREEYLYVNRKKYHSLNVQLICSSNLRILNVIARYPGATHDSFIWNQSRCQYILRNLYLRTRRSFYLLGDSGYPLRPWLLTPFDGNPEPGTPQYEFNQHLKKTRCLIERCNGVLKMRFRCLLKHRVLHYTPEKAGKLINACVVLHNICVENNMPEPDPEIEDDLLDLDYGIYAIGNENDTGGAGGMARVNPELVEGRRIRNIVMNYFQNVN
ncbi:putative nuclease HARBI1 [Coccinella septempunctata]|uniref:putative nuclease HARBI1 n=1 Tax=Coccinella septempunctata TaxID=41139 RepID=UPI001D078900|nr:putative nuclease HARBI1 [Coccinella septempunctata]